MKSKELVDKYREMSLAELHKKLQEKRNILIKTKMEFSFGKNKIHTNISKIKKEIANINTIISDNLIGVAKGVKENNDK